jgi:basic amino acid/polyamine antiporter, APA family
VWVMRERRPDVPRPFRTPWVPLVPILGMVISVALIISSGTPAKVAFLIWLAVGLVIYFAYSRNHSVQRLKQSAAD